VDVIPDRAMTKTAMIETSVRVGIFVDQNKTLPRSLDKLPKREGYMNRMTDAWKRSLIWLTESQQAGGNFSSKVTSK